MTVETVKIATPGVGRGWAIINKSDFDPQKHTLFDGEKSAEPAPKKRGRPKK